MPRAFLQTPPVSAMSPCLHLDLRVVWRPTHALVPQQTHLSMCGQAFRPGIAALARLEAHSLDSGIPLFLPRVAR